MKVSKISTQIEFSNPINEWLNGVFMYIRSCSLKEVSLNNACFMFQFQKIWLNREVLYCALLSAFKTKLLAKDSVLWSKPLFSELRNIILFPALISQTGVEQNTWKWECIIHGCPMRTDLHHTADSFLLLILEAKTKSSSCF